MYNHSQRQEATNLLLVRMNHLEQQHQALHQAMMSAFGAHTLNVNRQVSAINRNIQRMAVQPPRQLWQATLQRQNQARVARQNAAAGNGAVLGP